MSRAKQSTGNYGEKRVLKELARLGWAAINANELRYNMPGYDIIAHRPIYGSLTFDMALSADRKIFISVKTRGPTSNHFQIGGFKRSEIIEPLSYDPKQFTILVSKADQPEDDSFYVMPSHVFTAECAERQRQIWNKDTHARDRVLSDAPKPRRNGEPRAGHDLARKWAEWFNNWGLLDKALG